MTSTARVAHLLRSARFNMKYRGLLGVLISVVACGSKESGPGGSGATGGSNTTVGTGGNTSTGTGGSGTNTSGSGNATATGGSGTTTSTGASVLERNGGPTREGTWVQPTLTKDAAAKMALDSTFKATFKGSMYASPLYSENGGPGGKGIFIAVSADNEVAALDETTGATVWTKNLGASPGAKGQGCGFASDPVGS